MNAILSNAGRVGEKRIADNALVAFTLLIAESKPDEWGMMVKVIINLINGKNEGDGLPLLKNRLLNRCYKVTSV